MWRMKVSDHDLKHTISLAKYGSGSAKAWAYMVTSGTASLIIINNASITS